MGGIDRKRLMALESKIGHSIPSDLLGVLAEGEPIRRGKVTRVTPGRVWDVRMTFSLDDGDRNDQLDSLYDLVGDVLPSGALPFAEDWGGDFYCLMLSGPHAGRVVYWSHERDEGDTRIEPVANSVADFFASLVPDPRE